ncbi:PulJ/GspJ family protein [Sulfurihydrogenibium yellowstonense]|uniref:Prepilin-type N-cleavage/methylation domain protein n=1 Tax=Sulfurihydrogenibium yellowstonense SS-5 TaxID=432331 RepID=C4FKQ0_9AQUI|nr:prepilin-type N-terminal cleavage/methylation domain-containing protein [Sulfurihydrogenibium yellowstonense]EEP60351.1 prepilin-type N- cleavage/methylation domain protein [Sulfurihydrogenibium yellowstonense SS-5]
MRNKGYTIFELLVVIALSLIVGAAFYTFYNTVIKENISKSTIAKQEQDSFILANEVVKDLSTIGFGVDADRLIIKDGTACDLDGTNNRFLTYCSSQKQLAYLSLAGSEDQYAGCWGFIDRTGKLNTYIVNDNNTIPLSYSYLNKQCPPNAGKYIRLNTSKKLLENAFTYDPNNPDPSKRNSYAFYIGKNTYPNDPKIIPSDFKVIYSLDDKNLPRECAPGTYNLQKTIGTSSLPSPVISCVLDFQVKYVKTDNTVSTSITNLNELSAIKLCMIVQVGGRQSVPDNPHNYSQAGGCDQFNYSNNDWRYYRWAVIEQVIPLMNIR